jgi:hypothetical protein
MEFPTSMNGLAAPRKDGNTSLTATSIGVRICPTLERICDENRIERVKTFIFGYDNPFHYLKPGSMDPQTLPASDSFALERRYRPQPGLYAVSVNFLTGFLFPRGYEDYLAYFRQRRPEARAGYSIFIYDVK